jgi:hypothetical protein
MNTVSFIRFFLRGPVQRGRILGGLRFRSTAKRFFKFRIDFIGLDFEKHPPMENAVKIVKWSGTFTAKLKLQ